MMGPRRAPTEKRLQPRPAEVGGQPSVPEWKTAVRKVLERVGATVGKATGRLVRVRWRRLLTITGLLASVALVVAGIYLIYAPAGLIASGFGLLALLTFDLAKVGRLTWPR
jgi:hypothetical protein